MHPSPARLSLVLGVSAVSLAGCFLDRTPIEGPQRSRDGGASDAGRADAGARDAGARDAARDAGARDAARDAGPRDAGPRDAGPPDAGPPDAGPPDSGPPSCDSFYGAAVGYVFCAERPTECEFVARLDGVRTCRTTCTALGGRCFDAYRNEVPFPACERQGDPIGCDVLHVDDICICSRGL